MNSKVVQLIIDLAIFFPECSFEFELYHSFVNKKTDKGVTNKATAWFKVAKNREQLFDFFAIDPAKNLSSR